MNSYIQLLTLVGSFIYGVILYYLNIFNRYIIKGKNILFKLLISILYVFNISLVYVCFLYKLNYGVLHIYNILFMLAGYILIAVKERK
jgi:hypothetical protein